MSSLNLFDDPAPPAPMSRLLVQANASEVEQIGVTCARFPFDAIYSAASNAGVHRFEMLAGKAHRHAELSGGKLPLLDANIYAGKNRMTGMRVLSVEWAKTQDALGLPYILTDSGFIEQGELDQLRSVLSQAVAIQKLVKTPVVAVLALAHTWLTERSEELRTEIEMHGVRVALAIEHTNDPFGSQKAVRGLIHVLRSSATIWVMRTDLSAIGALAVGAEHAAIGTTTSLRHIYPSGKPGGPNNKSEWPSVLMQRGLVWKTLDRIKDLGATFPDETMWLCNDCGTCHGRRMDVAIHSDEDAINHNNEVVLAILSDVLGSPDPVETWRQKCSSAQFSIADIESTTGRTFRTPGFLGAWWGATTPAAV